MMTEIIDSVERFHSLRDQWEEVYAADTESNLFLSWQWLRDQFERRTGSVCILAVKTAGDDAQSSRYCAFMPLKRQLHLNRQAVSFEMIYRMAGNHWADYTGLICRPGQELEAIVQLGRLLASLPWGRLYLECLKISDGRLALLLEPFSRFPFSQVERTRRDTADTHDLLRAPRITLPDTFDDYLVHRLSSNTRQRIRRYWRKFESDTSLVIRPSTTDTRALDLQNFERLWAHRWRADKQSKTDSLAKRYRQIIAQGLDGDTLQLHVMEQHGRCLAMIANYRDPVRQEVLFFVGARDQSYTTLPAGLLLHAQAIREAIELGYRHYDFLSGDEPYKYSLGATDQHLRYLMVSRDARDALCGSLDRDRLDSALSAVKAFQRSNAETQINQLYAQLQAAWPGEVRVVRAFEKWQMSLA